MEAGSAGFHSSARALLAQRPVTASQFVRRSAGGAGHRLVTGSPEQIADDLAAWHADGTAADAEAFAAEVVPLPVRRGMLRPDHPTGR